MRLWRRYVVIACTGTDLRTSCRDGGLLFLEGCALEGLELGKGGLELAREFLLLVFLRRLFREYHMY